MVSTPRSLVTALARALRSTSSDSAECGSAVTTLAAIFVGDSTRNVVSSCNRVASRAPISWSPSTGSTATLVTFEWKTPSLAWSCFVTQDCSNDPTVTLLLCIVSTATNATQAPARQPCSRKDPATTRLRVMTRTASHPSRLPARAPARLRMCVLESIFIYEIVQQERCLTRGSLAHRLQPVELFAFIGRPAGIRLSCFADQGVYYFRSLNKIEPRKLGRIKCVAPGCCGRSKIPIE